MRFILPPHPGSGNKCKREDLEDYEGEWVAQRKFNGTHAVIWINGDEINIWDRRGQQLTLYKLTETMKACLLGLDLNNKETVFAGEILHTKAKRKDTNEQAARHTIVLFDVLFHERYLSNINQDERLELLESICRHPNQLEKGAFFGATKRAFTVSEVGESSLWLAERFYDNFVYHFDECDETDKRGYDKYPEIEGLILRLKDSKLQANPKTDVSWIIRCRKPKSKIYDF